MKPFPFQRSIVQVGNARGFTVPADQIKQGRILEDWEYEIQLIPVRKIQKGKTAPASSNGAVVQPGYTSTEVWTLPDGSEHEILLAVVADAMVEGRR